MRKKRKTMVEYYLMLQDRRYVPPVLEYQYASQDRVKRAFSLKEQNRRRFAHKFSTPRRDLKALVTNSESLSRASSSIPFRSRASISPNSSPAPSCTPSPTLSKESTRQMLRQLRVPASFVSAKMAAVLCERGRTRK
jgi:hypothetical protein